jgi:hypothetical protein
LIDDNYNDDDDIYELRRFLLLIKQHQPKIKIMSRCNKLIKILTSVIH